MAYSDFGSIVNDLAVKTTPRDVIICIGAGDVNEIAFEMLRRREVISTRLRAIKASQLTAEAA
jgi:UDP-N-acetylmuramate-alanine ligase